MLRDFDLGCRVQGFGVSDFRSWGLGFQMDSGGYGVPSLNSDSFGV